MASRIVPKIVFDKVTRRFDLSDNSFIALDRLSLDI
ncbi:MAG: ATP-binding protein, partial [Mesorhizobium sp.]